MAKVKVFPHADLLTNMLHSFAVRACNWCRENSYLSKLKC